MNNTAFFKKLNEALCKLGASEEDAANRVAQVSSFIASLPPEDAARALSPDMDINAFAKELLRTSFEKPEPKRRAASAAPSASPSDTRSPAQTAKVSTAEPPDTAAYKDNSEKAEAKETQRFSAFTTLQQKNNTALSEKARALAQKAEREEQEGTRVLYRKDKNAPASDAHLKLKANPAEKKDSPVSDRDFFSKEFTITTTIPVMTEREDTGEDMETKAKKKSRSDKPSRKKSLASTAREGGSAFWLLFAATLPLTIAALLAAAAVFSFIFVFLFFIIAGLIGALIAYVSAGTLITLVGIGYGGYQMALAGAFAAGLYEVGLGICVGAVTIAGSIIIYNIAVRLIPWIIKNIVNLFFYLIKKLKDLFVRAKEASAKL